MNQEHLKILAEVTGMSPAILTNELSIGVTRQALAAMQRLQEQIDELRKHNEQLTGEKFSERNHAALQFQVKELQAENERLRGENMRTVINNYSIDHCDECGMYPSILYQTKRGKFCSDHLLHNDK